MHSFLCTFKAFNIVSHFNDHGPTNQGSEILKKNGLEEIAWGVSGNVCMSCVQFLLGE